MTENPIHTDLVTDLQNQVTEWKTAAEQSQKQYIELLEYFAEKLTPCVVDVNMVKGRFESILGVEEKLRSTERVLNNEKERHVQEISDLKREIESLRAAIEKQQEENVRLLTRVESVELQAQQQQEKAKQHASFTYWISSCLKSFERKV